MKRYDLIVIGTGPAGQKGAIQAAKLGKSVAVIEKNDVLGGVSVNTGTIPSKSLREAVMLLTGRGKRELFGDAMPYKKQITVGDVAYMADQVRRREWAVIRGQFERNNVDMYWGSGRFTGAHEIEVSQKDGPLRLSASYFLIAVGTKPAAPADIPFDGEVVCTSDTLLEMKHLPRTMIVVGGGVIGTEYSCIFAALGVQVILIEGRSEVLGFLDQQITEALQYQMRDSGVTLRLQEKVDKIEIVASEDGAKRTAQALLASGKKVRAEALLYAVGRQGVCSALDLHQVGIPFDDRERLTVNEHYQTVVPHIYAAGDVIGFPALASTSMEQGRRAVCHAFGAPCGSLPGLFPYGIYGIPEVSMVGRSEEELTAAGVPYEVGIAYYREVARAQMLGDESGMLKLLIHQESHKILGIHIIGSGATELIHIGQTAMAFSGTVDFFINNVFNYPTLAEAYKIAALNVHNKLNGSR